MTKRYPRQWPFAKQNIHLFQKSEIQPATGLQNRMNLQMSRKFQQQIAGQLGLDETFRLVVNNGAKAGQSVFHLHLHLISGRPLNWPPG